MAPLNGFGCFSCALPVRFTGDHRHPGYVVIDQVVGPTAPGITSGELPDLRILHRFCSHTSRTGRYGRCSSIRLRRAWLGWATHEFEASQDKKHYGTKHYPRLGLHPAQIRPELFRKYWRIRVMACAALACRYYPRCQPLHNTRRPG